MIPGEIAHTNPHDCEEAIGLNFLQSGRRRAGEQTTCPGCGRRWMHTCDEANGCYWSPVATKEVVK